MLLEFLKLARFHSLVYILVVGSAFMKNWQLGGVVWGCMEPVV